MITAWHKKTINKDRMIDEHIYWERQHKSLGFLELKRWRPWQWENKKRTKLLQHEHFWKWRTTDKNWAEPVGKKCGNARKKQKEGEHRRHTQWSNPDAFENVMLTSKKKSHHFEMWFYTWRRHISIKLVTLFFRFCCCVHMVLCFCYYCRPSYALRVRPHRFAIACNHAIQARTHNTIRRHYQMTATDAPIMLRKEFSHSIYTTRQNRV